MENAVVAMRHNRSYRLTVNYCYRCPNKHQGTSTLADAPPDKCPFSRARAVAVGLEITCLLNFSQDCFYGHLLAEVASSLGVRSSVY